MRAVLRCYDDGNRADLALIRSTLAEDVVPYRADRQPDPTAGDGLARRSRWRSFEVAPTPVGTPAQKDP